MNLSLQTSTIPMEWKKSLMVPVPKTFSATTPNDYRPIDLPFEYPKQSAGTPHLPYYFRPSSESVYPMSDSQWGFQPGVTAHLAAVDNWLRIFDEEVNYDRCSLF